MEAMKDYLLACGVSIACTIVVALMAFLLGCAGDVDAASTTSLAPDAGMDASGFGWSNADSYEDDSPLPLEPQHRAGEPFLPQVKVR